MATQPLQAGDAPANGALAPDTFRDFAYAGFAHQRQLAALIEAIEHFMSELTPEDDRGKLHHIHQAVSLLELAGAEAARLSGTLTSLEMAGHRFARESR